MIFHSFYVLRVTESSETVVKRCQKCYREPTFQKSGAELQLSDSGSFLINDTKTWLMMLKGAAGVNNTKANELQMQGRTLVS